jgi:hypothetical protein
MSPNPSLHQGILWAASEACGLAGAIKLRGRLRYANAEISPRSGWGVK